MTAEPAALGAEDFRRWAEDLRGPVALTLSQKLLPLEGDRAIIFPATYANRDAPSSYNIDRMADETSVAQIDSVGSQANRMEELFIPDSDGRRGKDFSDLVPQVWIRLQYNRPGGEGEKGEAIEKEVSLMKAGHRLGDALVRSSGIGKSAARAFADWQDRQDAGPLAKLGPTSLVFGAWDSRGKGAKLPRLVSSTIRAWDVEELTRSAQYFPPIRYADFGVFDPADIAAAEEEAKKSGGTKPLSKRGYVETPAVGALGGIRVHGDIIRTVTVNLVALRALNASENAALLRSYILGLTLIAATDDQDGFLRQGCLLTPDPSSPGRWEEVARNGERRPIRLDQALVEPFARDAARTFGVADVRRVDFDRKAAQGDVKEEGKKGSKKQKGDEVDE